MHKYINFQNKEESMDPILFRVSPPCSERERDNDKLYEFCFFL